MSKHIDKQSILDSIQEEFTPGPAHIRSKEAFWSEMARLGISTQDLEINATKASQYAQNTSIQKWWNIPGFQEWFLEKDWDRLTAMSTAHLALSQITRVLKDAGAAIPEKLAAAKVAREYYDRLVPQQEQKFQDEEIGQMDRTQLEQFIKKQTKLLTSEKN